MIKADISTDEFSDNDQIPNPLTDYPDIKKAGSIKDPACDIRFIYLLFVHLPSESCQTDKA